MDRCPPDPARRPRRPPTRCKALLPRAAWGVAGVLAGAGQPIVATAEEPYFTAGCLIHGYAFTGELPPTPEEPLTGVSSAGSCQQLCVSTTGCRAFSYWPTADTGHAAQECRLYASAEAALVEDSVAISGPEYCHFFRDVCTSAEPTAQWPPREEGIPAVQAWPRFFQPGPFQCYAADETGTALPCNELEVVQDSQLAWPGRCEDFDIVSTDAGFDCEEGCRLNASCAVFAVESNSTNCYMAPVGRNCRLGSIVPMHAKRFARSHPRYVETNVNLTGIQVMGLENVYNVPNMEAIDSNDQEINDCRSTCASVFGCSLWQLSAVGGCYIEMPTEGMQAAYPLELGPGLQLYSDLAPQMIAGGFMEQVCMGQLPPTTTLTGNVEAVFTFPEMDFAVLSANDTLMDEASAAIAAGVAALAGQPYTPMDVITLLNAGSVVANSTLVVSDPQVDRDALARRLETGLITDPYAVITRLQAVPGINDACNGAPPSHFVGTHVTVTQAAPPSTTVETTTTTTVAPVVEEEWHVRLDDVLVVLVSFCFLGAFLVGAYYAIVCCQRSKKTRAHRHMEEEDAFDRYDDDKSGGITREEFIRHYTEEQSKARAIMSQPDEFSDRSSTSPLMVQAVQPPPLGYSAAPSRTVTLPPAPIMGGPTAFYPQSQPMYQPIGGSPMHTGELNYARSYQQGRY